MLRQPDTFCPSPGTMLRTLLHLGLLSLTVASAGCLPSRPLPVLVEVADARTGNPLSGVVIRASGGTLYAPTFDDSVLGPPGATVGPPPDPAGGIAETDDRGRAVLEIAGRRPVSLRFFRPGYAEGHLIVTTSDVAVRGASTWTLESRVPGIVRSAPLTSPVTETGSAMMFRVVPLDPSRTDDPVRAWPPY